MGCKSAVSFPEGTSGTHVTVEEVSSMQLAPVQCLQYRADARGLMVDVLFFWIVSAEWPGH